MLDLTPESVFGALGINSEKLATLESDVLQSTKAFYDLDYTTAFIGDRREYLRAGHTKFAEMIGETSDIIFLNNMLRSGVDLSNGITDIYPLRGAISLVPGTEGPGQNHLLNFSKQFNVPYSAEMIGVKRNGVDAHTYFPLEHNGFDPNRVYRIKDFGIATGGTAIELAQRLMNSGVDPHNIYIQGAVGTKYANERIVNAMQDYAIIRFPGEYSEESKPDLSKQVMFSVMGEMPVERGDESIPDQKFYLDTLIDNGTRVPVNAKDWGDVTCTDMKIPSERAAFLARVNKVNQAINGSPLQDHEQEQLMQHYEKVAA